MDCMVGNSQGQGSIPDCFNNGRGTTVVLVKGKKKPATRNRSVPDFLYLKAGSKLGWRSSYCGSAPNPVPWGFAPFSFQSIPLNCPFLPLLSLLPFEETEHWTVSFWGMSPTLFSQRFAITQTQLGSPLF